MTINLDDIKSDRQWKASIGMNEESFLVLVPFFRAAYKDIYGVEMEERQKISSKAAHFKTYKELLFFLLFSLKSDLTFDALGLVFGIAASTAKKNQTIGLKILAVALKKNSELLDETFKEAGGLNALVPMDLLIKKSTNRRRRRRIKQVVVKN